MADGIDVEKGAATEGATQVMDGATTVMEPSGGASAGDTGEFLKILSTPEPAASVPSVPGVGDQGQPEDAKPIVIKGGPRRVVRADGRTPEMSFPLGQRRFALSSGHEMFARRKPWRKVMVVAAALLAVVAVSLAFFAAWQLAQRSITTDQQQRAFGTSDYDGALSVTPANDGGYYTVFLATSTPTDEKRIGALSDVVMYRTGKQVSDAVVVTVPTDLYVTNVVYDANGNALTQARAISDVLALQGVSKTLQGICDAFGLRLYNVVVCPREVYDDLASVMSGSVPASSIDPQTLYGKARSNLEPEEILQFCGDVGALDRASVRYMAAPTTPIEANGSILSRGSAPAFSTTLNAVYNGRMVDDRGYYVGTTYDEWGNPVLDDYGNPVGALYDENGQMIFDENGYLQLWGQQYDDRGYPVGTAYYDDGTPILDWNGNPYGTQYGDDGQPLRDWRGNMVIYS